MFISENIKGNINPGKFPKKKDIRNFLTYTGKECKAITTT